MSSVSAQVAGQLLHVRQCESVCAITLWTEVTASPITALRTLRDLLSQTGVSGVTVTTWSVDTVHWCQHNVSTHTPLTHTVTR